MIQIILNALIVILVAVPLIRDCRVNPVKLVFRYFTTQSNVLCAAASFAMIIALLAGKVPQAVILLKYVGTAAVTVTLLTVFFFPAPLKSASVIRTARIIDSVFFMDTSSLYVDLNGTAPV